jgi:hypothetical protein
VDKVFERCYKKFSERIGEDGENIWTWEEVKVKQKAELKTENESLYGNYI